MFAEMLLGTLPKMPPMKPSIIHRITTDKEIIEAREIRSRNSKAQAQRLIDANNGKHKVSRAKIVAFFKGREYAQQYQVEAATGLCKDTVRQHILQMIDQGIMYNHGTEKGPVYSMLKTLPNGYVRTKGWGYAEAAVLSAMAGKPPMTAKQIAQMCGLSDSTVRRIIRDCLVQDGHTTAPRCFFPIPTYRLPV